MMDFFFNRLNPWQAFKDRHVFHVGPLYFCDMVTVVKQMILAPLQRSH